MTEVPGASRIAAEASPGRAFTARFVGLAVGRAGASALSAVWLLLAARQLDVTAFGDLSLVLTLGLVASSISESGLLWRLSDVAARTPDAATAAVRVVDRKRGGLTLIGACVVVAGYVPVANDGSIVIALALVPSLLATAWYSTRFTAMRSVGHVRPEPVNEIVSRAVVLVAGTAVLAWGGGVLAVVLTYSVVDVVSAVIAGRVARGRLAGGAPLPDPTTFDLRRSVALVCGAWLTVVYLRADVWLVGWLDGSEAVARYSAAYRLLDVALLPAAAMSALVIAAVADGGPVKAKAALGRSIATAAGTVGAGAAVLGIAAPWVLEVLFGPAYVPAAGVLRLLAAAAVPAAVVYVVAPVVAVVSRRQLAIALACALAVKVVANLVLIPELGPAGAAWSNLACHLALAPVLWRIAHRHLSSDDHHLELSG